MENKNTTSSVARINALGLRAQYLAANPSQSTTEEQISLRQQLLKEMKKSINEFQDSVLEFQVTRAIRQANAEKAEEEKVTSKN